MSQTTTTPNYGLIKPNVNSDNDLWGDHWNQNADTLDSKIKTIENKAGVVTWNTRSGAVSLLQADVTTVLPPGAGTPAMDGTATAGALLTWSRSDHVHPTDTTRYAASNPAGYVTAAQAGTAAPVQSVATRTGAVVLTHNDLTDWAATLAPYAPLASPAMTGSPTAPTVTPTTDASTKLATTAFVQSALGAVPGGAIVSATPPAANPGALWFDSTGGQTYVRYDDGNTVQWVPSANITGLANAAQLSDVAPSYNNVGRNLIHNSMFNIAQRGAGPWAGPAGGYTADRWVLGGGSDVSSVQIALFSDGARAQIGDEAAAYALSNAFTGNAAAGAFTYVAQPMEGVRRLGGKSVTVSFWAACLAGTLKLGVSIDQFFGTGGSPSASVQNNGQAVTLSTTWTRYSLTFALPSLVGKTLGTNGNDATWFQMWYSSGANLATRAGNIGVQSGTIQLWGVQLEITQPGQTQPTQLEKPDPELQLRQCQRFYVSLYARHDGYVTAGTSAFQQAYLPVTMRAAPTVTPSFSLTTNVSAPTTTAINPGSFIFGGAGTASGGYQLGGTFTASADL